ncbi:MAG: IS66 family transposase [Nitrospiraceae bacterium]|nr:IS66 family transposase [Nitrospiraceae bacterium]
MNAAELQNLSKPELVSLILRLDKRLGQLESRVEALEQENAALRKRNAELEAEMARLRKNSSNSSKPPSSDIVKPPKPQPKGKGKKRRRKIGGQRGHPKHERAPFPVADLDDIWEYELGCCPNCGGRVKQAKAGPRVVQQVEVIKSPVRIEEHRGLAYYCSHCDKVHYAPLPPDVRKGGLLGPRLTALVAYLKCACHASFSTIRKFLRDMMKITISRGQLTKVIRKVSRALGGAYEELRDRLFVEPQLNVDETGHKENGQRFWTWCFRAEMYTLFKIDPSRGSDVLIDVLGKEFNGVLGCDYFSAYRKYMKDFGVAVQFCLAHLIRDVKFLTTLSDRVTRNYGERVLDGLRRLFRVIHRRDEMTEARFDKAIEKARADLVTTAKRAPPRSEARNLAKRFRQHGDAYFRFITTPGVEPTNNLAEQAIRFVVIDRHITQGTRSETGRQWCERIWTVIATCTQQGRSVLEYLVVSA